MTLLKKKKRQEMISLSPAAAIPSEHQQPSPSSSTLHSLPSPSSSYSSAIPSSSRYDSSLSLLTKRFINLMVSTPGDIDLKQAAILLNVQKRRIYDITNVLEGIHLIEKVSKNHVRWIGDRHSKEDKRQTTRQQQKKKQQRKQQHDKLIELQKANRELELEHSKLIQLEDNIKKCTAHTLEHPQCHLLKHDLALFLQDHQQERSPAASESSSSLSCSSGQQPFSPSTSLFLPPLLQRNQTDDPYHHSKNAHASVFIPKSQ